MGGEQPEEPGLSTLNPYERKQEARRLRLLDASARAKSEAEQLHQRATGMAGGIPFGHYAQRSLMRSARVPRA